MPRPRRRTMEEPALSVPTARMRGDVVSAETVPAAAEAGLDAD